MAQVVGRRPLIEESRVRFKTRPCRIGGGERRTGTDVTVYKSENINYMVRTQLSMVRTQLSMVRTQLSMVRTQLDSCLTI